jgi:RHH-type transcriptional regulator, rel operon repressor / antitoxin RelB
MLGVRLDKALEARLDKLAKATGRSKSYYAKVAIRQFLDEREEYLLGLAVLEGVGVKAPQNEPEEPKTKEDEESI